MGLLERVGRFIDDVLLLPDDVRGEVERGERALEAGAFDEAEGRFVEALSVRPALARAWIGLALSREGLGDLRGAREAFEEARELAPGDGEIAWRAARVALAQEDTEAALAHGRVAVARLPRSDAERAGGAWLLLARAERFRGRSERALRELHKALAFLPHDVAVRVELAEVAAELERAREVVAAVRGLEPEALAPAEAGRMGEALRRVGDARAAAWLRRGAEGGEVRAMERLARWLHAAGDDGSAEAWARRAVAAGGGTSSLTVLAEVLVAGGRTAEAADCFAAASQVAGGDLELARAAVRTVPLDDAQALARHADAVERLEPHDPAARAARAWEALHRGDLAAASSLLASPNEARGWLGRALWAVRSGRPREALEALERFDALEERHAWAVLDRERAEELRREALRRAWRTPAGEVDLAGVMDAVVRFASERDLAWLERGVRGVRDELDRPVRLAVVGEFNAGKSTLVNAFLGAEVAPMGVLPTTANVHVLKAGATRRVRVVHGDGRTREGEWAELAGLLGETSASEVDQVEIIAPSERLERVWLVDTPGTNAAEEGPEQPALRAAERADVVLWVFDAAQAGKATEGRVLAALRRARRPVLAVVNKRDRVEPSAIEQVRARVADALGLEHVPTLSARAALEARLADDEARWRDSGFEQLEGWLERAVFERSRVIKRGSCAVRLLGLLDAAREQEERERASRERAVARHAELESRLQRLGEAWADTVRPICQQLDRERERAVAEAAREVTALAGSGGRRQTEVDRADRAFVGEALGRRLAASIEEAERSLAGTLREVTVSTLAQGQGPAELDPESVLREVRASMAAAFGAYAGYQRGLIDGGRIDRFFDSLPAWETEPERIARVLAPVAADPFEELRPALLEAMARAVRTVVAERRAARDEVQRALAGRRRAVDEPLKALRDVLDEMA